MLALLMPFLIPASVSAGEYTVAQCHTRNAAAADMQVDKHRAYVVANGCDRPADDSAVKLRMADRASIGTGAYVSWEAPPGTKIVGVRVETKLRRDNGVKARLYMADVAGIEQVRLATGGTGGTVFKTERWTVNPGGPGRAAFTAALICERTGGCPESSIAKTWLRNLEITLRDTVAPTVEGTGSILLPGWKRGIHDLRLEARDIGGGVSKAEAASSGAVFAALRDGCSRISGSSFASRLVPCADRLVIHRQIDTAQSPFAEGINQLQICAASYGIGAIETCMTRAVHVDNVAPRGRFANRQHADDPELIRVLVSDVTSGVHSGEIRFRAVGDLLWRPLHTTLGSGELRARVDSQAERPGRYEFEAEVRDVAGNTSTTRLRGDGSRMVLDFPLKTGTILGARLPTGGRRQIVPYRRDSRVTGRLTDLHGRPIAQEKVTVTERFDAGSLIGRRTRRVTTDANGAYRSLLPGGPSRRVTVEYAGSARYVEVDSRQLDLNVASAAQLRTSDRKVRAGRSVSFRGRVKRYFARIPAGGKLIELQVKEGRGRWGTVREAFSTNRRGRYRLRYRFGTFYIQPTTFKFRVKVTREQGWPYRAPVRSRTRKVTIVPRG